MTLDQILKEGDMAIIEARIVHDDIKPLTILADSVSGRLFINEVPYVGEGPRVYRAQIFVPNWTISQILVAMSNDKSRQT